MSKAIKTLSETRARTAGLTAVLVFSFALSLFASVSHAKGHACEAAFIDPTQLISDSFSLKESGLRALITRFRTSRLDFSKPLSKKDIEMLVIRLDESRHGNANKWRDLIDQDRSRFALRVLRAQRAEIARQGLISYFESRDLIREKSAFLTKLRSLLRSPKAQLLFSAQSLISIATPVPIVVAPNLSLFRITPEQFETLSLFGIESAEGQLVLESLFPKHQRDTRFRLFVRSFNKASFVLATWMIVNLVATEDAATAKKNGDQFTASVVASTNELEAALARPADTQDDIHFDEALKLLTSRGLEDSPELRSKLCGKFNAPNRCPL